MIGQFITETAKFFNEMAIYLVFGFFVAGVLHVFFPDNFITRHLGKGNWKSVFKSSLFGIPLPLCSCGVIPVAASLKKKGASNGATLSFLISTPQIGTDSFFITYSLIGWVFAVFRIAAAFITAVLAGTLTNFFSKEKKVEPAVLDKAASNGIKERLHSIFHYIQVELLGSIAGYLAVGILIAGAIAAFVPANFFSMYLNNQFLSMLLMLVVSVPMYVCATSSTPIAASLLLKGLSPGAALVFLLAGPATNALTISTVVKTMGKKVAVIYVGAISFVSVGLGYLLNFLFYNRKLPVVQAHSHDMLPGWLQLAGSIILLLMLGGFFITRYIIPLFKKKNMSDMVGKLSLNVQGMTCTHCSSTVHKAVSSIAGTGEVLVDLDNKKVFFEGDPSNITEVKKAIEDNGFQVE